MDNDPVSENWGQQRGVREWRGAREDRQDRGAAQLSTGEVSTMHNRLRRMLDLDFTRSHIGILSNITRDAQTPESEMRQILAKLRSTPSTRMRIYVPIQYHVFKVYSFPVVCSRVSSIQMLKYVIQAGISLNALASDRYWVSANTQSPAESIRKGQILLNILQTHIHILFFTSAHCNSPSRTLWNTEARWLQWTNSTPASRPGRGWRTCSWRSPRSCSPCRQTNTEVRRHPLQEETVSIWTLYKEPQVMLQCCVVG